MKLTDSTLTLVLTVLIGIGGWYTMVTRSNAVNDVQVASIIKQVDQQQKTLNYLTIRSAKMDEQRSASQEAIKMLSGSLNGLSDSNHKLAIVVEGFGVRLEGLEGEVKHLRSSFERSVVMDSR